MRALALLLLATLLPAADQVRAVFIVADAFVKDRLLSGVAVGLARSATAPHEVSGRTGADGRWTAAVAAGTWYATFRLDGYVAVERSPVELRPPAQEVTTALSMKLEEEGRAGQRRLRLVLTWGSRSDQARDLDAHAICPCPEAEHVFFSRKEHRADGHRLDLDVDDTDWGGPETITLLDPPPGSHRYWLHQYSASGSIAGSDVVVRGFAGDLPLGEWRPGAEAVERQWAPFRELRVDALGDARIIAWSEAERAAGLHLSPPQLPADLLRQRPEADPALGHGSGDDDGIAEAELAVAIVLFALLLAGVVGAAVWRRMTG